MRKIKGLRILLLSCQSSYSSSSVTRWLHKMFEYYYYYLAILLPPCLSPVHTWLCKTKLNVIPILLLSHHSSISSSNIIMQREITKHNHRILIVPCNTEGPGMLPMTDSLQRNLSDMSQRGEHAGTDIIANWCPKRYQPEGKHCDFGEMKVRHLMHNKSLLSCLITVKIIHLF